MTEVTVQLSDEVLDRLQDEARRLNMPVESVISAAILHFPDDDEPAEAEILAGLRRSMEQALAGTSRPAHDVLDEIEREDTGNADNG